MENEEHLVKLENILHFIIIFWTAISKMGEPNVHDQTNA